MQMNVLEETKTRLVFELKGADHTLCNVLKAELWNDKDVNVATYAIAHPLIGIPRLIVETKAGNPREAVKAACARLEKKNKDFAAKFKAA